MPIVDALLLKAVVEGGDDAAFAAECDRLRGAPGLPAARWTLHRGIRTPDAYAYGEFVGPAEVADAERRRLVEFASRLPHFAAGTPTIDRLERGFGTPGASAGETPAFHYVVEMDPAAGWEDELFRWYDAEHMPGLAAVPGCVRAQRYVNRDGGPQALACYDLIDPSVLESPAWLAVRRTTWSGRVPPQFRNTRRTMFRSLPPTPD